MTVTAWKRLAIAGALSCSLALGPVLASASPDDDHGNGNGRGKAKGHDDRQDQGNQGKSPKKHGYHDNRNHWWKHREGREGSVEVWGLSHRRQQTKNEWRNIAIAAGAAAIIGLLNHDRTLVFVGTAGALYSLYRYEQDRKSQSRIDRLRAAYFSRRYFVRDGRRYTRRTVTRHGQRYYQFVRR